MAINIKDLQGKQTVHLIDDPWATEAKCGQQINVFHPGVTVLHRTAEHDPVTCEACKMLLAREQHTAFRLNRPHHNL